MSFCFEDQVLDLARRELSRSGVPVEVEPRVFDLLVYLIENKDRVVTKDDLIANVWAGRIVSDSALAGAINSARKAVGDSGQAQRLIRTVHRKGFRFIGSLSNGAARQLEPILALPDKPSIAVLPFANISGEADQEYFADGIVEDIITALSQVASFLVIARNSTFTYKGTSPNIRHVGRELGVRYVLEGTVRKSADRLRVTTQLIDAVSGGHVWAERYDRRLDDIFTLQDDITGSVVGSIEPHLYAAESFRSRGQKPTSLNAWGCITRAISHFARYTEEDLRAAEALLRQAIDYDPDYARPIAMLAAVKGNIAHLRGGPERVEALRAAREMAQRALVLDHDDPWVLMCAATIPLFMRRYEEAIETYSKCLELNPNFSAGHSHMALALASVGRAEEAVRYTAEAMRLSPRDPLMHMFQIQHALGYFAGGHYREAAEYLQKALLIHPGYISALRILPAAQALCGDLEPARASLRELKEALPGFTLAWVDQASILVEPLRERLKEGLRLAGLPD